MSTTFTFMDLSMSVKESAYDTIMVPLFWIIVPQNNELRNKILIKCTFADVYKKQ